MEAEDPLQEHLVEVLHSAPRILRVLNARAGSPLDVHDLADVAQDVVLIVMRKLEGGARPLAFRSWVFGICHLELRNTLRRVIRRRARAVEPEADAVSTDDRAGLQESEEIQAGLARLSESEAVVLRLKYFEDLSFEELAGRLGLPLGTVKTRHYRALRKIQAFLVNRRQEIDLA